MAQLQEQAATTPVQSFRRQFPFDVMIKIIACLDIKSLSVFSLTSSQYNDEANRFLWSSLTILGRTRGTNALEHFKQYYNVLVRAPQRAQHVRDLRISMGSIPWSQYDSVQPQIFHILSSVPNLRHLSISALTRPPVPIENPTSLPPTHNLPRLTSIKILGYLTPPWVDFLASQSDVTSLKWISPSSMDVTDLPATTLPNLRHVALHSKSTEIFVPGRPVSVVDALVHSTDDISTLSQALTRSIVPVLELQITIFPSSSVDFSFLGDALPALQYLRIQHENRSTLLQLSNFPQLQVFWSISYPISNVEEITTLTSGCPLLHTMVVTGQIKTNIWHRFSVDKPWVDLSVGVHSSKFSYKPDCAQYLLENTREALRRVDHLI